LGDTKGTVSNLSCQNMLCIILTGYRVIVKSYGYLFETVRPRMERVATGARLWEKSIETYSHELTSEAEPHKQWLCLQ